MPFMVNKEKERHSSSWQFKKANYGSLGDLSFSLDCKGKLKQVQVAKVRWDDSHPILHVLMLLQVLLPTRSDSSKGSFLRNDCYMGFKRCFYHSFPGSVGKGVVWLLC